MPPVPQVLLRLLEKVADDGVSADTLADLIGQDPVIAARVLAAANSAAFRRNRAMVRLKDCVQILGLRLIRTIATCLAVQQSFDPLAARTQADLAGFWRHALTTAEAARALAAATALAATEDAYLGGLLHDLGELLFLNGWPEYAGLLALCPDEASLPVHEQTHFGCDHAAAGAWLIGHWRLDARLADAILFHHCSAADIADADGLSRVVWVAHDWIACGDLTDAAARLLGTDAARLLPVLDGIGGQIEQMAAAIGIGGTTASALPVVGAPVPVRPGNADVSAGLSRQALLQPLQFDLPGLASPGELIASLTEAARILFGIEKIAFLLPESLPESDGTALRCASGATASLQDFSLPAAPARHLAGVAIEHDRPAVSWAAPGTMAMQLENATLGDIRLMRAFDADSLLCLPLRTLQRSVGVLAIGCRQEQRDRCMRLLPGITDFTRLAALTLAAWQDQRGRLEADRRNSDEHHLRHGRRLAHEAGNPLGIIKNYLTLLKRKMPDEESVQDELSVIHEELGRVARILERLGTADATDSGAPLDEIVRDMLVLYEPALIAPRRLVLETRLGAAQAQTACAGDSVRQILLNLLKNAAAALPEGGRITVSTSADHYLRAHRCTELCITDDGPGLPPDVREKLLHPDNDPPPAASRGLGLGIVRELVAACAGEIIVSSRPGGGTAFSILLPMQATTTQEEAR